jgi:hypothetical protein
MGHFPKPESERLPLSDGEWIDVKKRLTHGEREDMFARMSPHAFQVDRREVRTAKVVAYLLGWSFTDGEHPGEGQPVPMSPDLPESTRIDTIRSLDPDDFEAIHTAIESHERLMAEARAAAKKKTAGTPASDPISPSPSAVTGPSPTSAR